MEGKYSIGRNSVLVRVPHFLRHFLQRNEKGRGSKPLPFHAPGAMRALYLCQRWHRLSSLFCTGRNACATNLPSPKTAFKSNTVHLSGSFLRIWWAVPTLHFFVMLSEAKHLVFRDSSVAFGSLRMTTDMPSPHLGAY